MAMALAQVFSESALTRGKSKVMIKRSLNSLRKRLERGTGWLLALLAVLVVVWTPCATAQRATVQKLTLSQIEGLVAHKVPDSPLSSQIRLHGIAFKPTPAILEELRTIGAGPLTIAVIETMIYGGANAGGAGVREPAAAAASSRYDAPTPRLSEARQAIPIEINAIFQSLDQGNPQGARQFFTADVLNDARQLDAICTPFNYRTHYVVSIVERPGNVFEVRVRALFKPLKETAQVFIFIPGNGVFLLTQVEPDPFTAEAEQAKESVRKFIFAVRAGQWETAAHYVSPHLSLDPLKGEEIPRLCPFNYPQLGPVGVGVYGRDSVSSEVLFRGRCWH